MVGPTQADGSGPTTSLKALRSKLNSLNYYQPLSEDSVALAERLLHDLLRAAETFRQLQQRAAEREKEMKERLAELNALRWENPRLLKENTELHRRLLEDSGTHETRRTEWAARTEKSEQRLLHQQSLLEMEGTRALELRETLEQLRSRLMEMRSLDAGVGLSTMPRAPSILIRGSTPPPPAPSEPLEDAPDEGELARLSEWVAGLSEALSTERGTLAREVAALRTEEVKEVAASQELRRLGTYEPPAGDEAATQRSTQAAAAKEEEAQLKSHADFLSRACEALRDECEQLAGQLKEVHGERGALQCQGAAVQQEIRMANAALATPVRSPGRLRSPREAEGRRRREMRLEHVALTEAQAQLAERLQAAKLRAEQSSADGAAKLTRLREELGQEQSSRPADQLARLEADFEAAVTRKSRAKVESTQLSAQLSALRTHSEAQRRLLGTRTEEAAASLRAAEVGEAEAAALEARLLSLEASVVEAQGETGELQACLQRATAEHATALAHQEALAASKEEAALQQEVEVRQDAQQRLSAELEMARAGAWELESQAQQAHWAEEQLRVETDQFRKKLKRALDGLSRVQKSHRELSALAGQGLRQLRLVQAESRAEKAAHGEMQQELEALTKEARRAELAAAQMVRDADQQEQLLRAQEQGVQAASEEAGRREQELAQQLQELEPGFEEVRQELASVQAQNQRLALQSREEPMQPPQTEVRLRELQSTLQQTESTLAEQAQTLSSASTACGDLSTRAGQLLREARRQRELLSEETEELVSLKATVAFEEKKSRGAAAGLALTMQRLQELQQAEQAAAAGLQEIQVRQQQLLGLMEGLTSTREQLAGRLHQIDKAIAEETRRQEQARAGPPGVKAEIEELTAEAARLKGIVQSIELEHRELQGLAAERGRSLERAREQASELAASRTELQWTLDQLHHAVDLQEGELVTGAQELEAIQAEAQVSEVAALAAQSEAREHMKEAALGLEDLVHLTRENQLLKEELQQIQQRNNTLAAATEEQKAQALPRQQALMGTELERSQAIGALQRAAEARQRNEEAALQMALSLDGAMQQAEQLKLRLGSVREAEEAARALLVARQTELLSWRAQLSEAARELESHELAAEEANVERARLRLAVGVQQAAASEACLGTAAASAEVESLQAEVEELQRELQDLQTALVTGRQAREEALRQQSHLQDQLTQQRQLQHQIEVEGLALRQRLGSADDAAGGIAQISPAAEPAAVTALRTTLEQQRPLLAEMTAERVALAEEVMELRAQLMRRSSANP